MLKLIKIKVMTLIQLICELNTLAIEMDKFNKIKLMNSSYSLPASPRESNTRRQISPQREEWALINQYKALEYERLKQKQRLIAQQKKNTFRRQLDNQLSSKSNVHLQQAESDRKYYEYITHQSHQQKEKEERQKYERILKRKQAEDDNARNLEINRNSRLRNHDTGYHLDIGQKSEEQRRRNTQNNKRTVIDTLDQQIRQKNEERQRSFVKEKDNEMKNLQYQYDYYDKRTDPQKNFSQNQRVYQYYQELQRQKRIKDIDIEHRIVDDAAYRKRVMEDERIRNEQMKKTKIKEEMRETLDQQVKEHTYKKIEQSKINPEQYSYGVIGNVFRERQSSYDKTKYMEELRMQVEEQKRKKKMENFMSEEEYKFNLNQLNKVVNGQYAHNGYHDRSMGTIGDNKLLKLADIRDRIDDQDANVVKQRLDSLRRSSNNTHIPSRTDRSF